MHNAVFQTQPINLTSDLPRSCAWDAGSGSRTRGRGRFASLQESTPKEKREEAHMSLVAVSVAALLQRASSSPQDLSSQRHLPFRDPCGTIYLVHQEMK